MSSVGEQFPAEQQRLRDLLSTYESLAGLAGTDCRFAIAAIRDTLAEAERAQASGDVVRIVQAFARMQAHS